MGGGTNANTGEEKENNLQYFNEMSGKQETHSTTGVKWNVEKIGYDQLGLRFVFNGVDFTKSCTELPLHAWETHGYNNMDQPAKGWFVGKQQ